MNEKNSILTACLMIFCVFIVGCSKQQGDRGAARQDSVKSGSHEKSLVGVWQVKEFQSMNDSIGVIKPDDPSKYIIEFREDGTVSIQLNCNRAMGRWAANPSSDSTSGGLQFSKVAVTRALCPPPSMDERIVRDLEYVRTYLFKDDRLYLSLMADAGIYELVRINTFADEIVYQSPEEGGPRNWIVSKENEGMALYSKPSTNADVLMRYEAGALLDNLGCQNESGSIWCDVQQLGGGPRGYVLAEKLEPAKGPDGSVPIGPDNSAYRLGQGEVDATGTVPCSLERGQPTSHCTFEVARAGGGYATLRILGPGNFERIIFFRLGYPIGISSSEAERTGEFSATKENDLHIIRVGNERYEVPDAVVLGG